MPRFADRTQGYGHAGGQTVKTFIAGLAAAVFSANSGRRLGEFLLQHQRLRQMLLELLEAITTDRAAIADDRRLADADAVGEALDADIHHHGGIAQYLLANFQIDA